MDTKTAKEITINYLKSVRDDIVGPREIDKIDDWGILIEINAISRVIQLVEESEGE